MLPSWFTIAACPLPLWASVKRAGSTGTIASEIACDVNPAQEMITFAEVSEATLAGTRKLICVGVEANTLALLPSTVTTAPVVQPGNVPKAETMVLGATAPCCIMPAFTIPETEIAVVTGGGGSAVMVKVTGTENGL